MKKFLFGLLAGLLPLFALAANPQVEMKTSQGTTQIDKRFWIVSEMIPAMSCWLRGPSLHPMSIV